MQNPASITNLYWIYANNRNDKTEIDPDCCGKWILHFNKTDIYDAWKIIYEETIKGNLSFNAKCSTSMEGPNSKPNEFVILVYSPNFHDINITYEIVEKVRKLIYYPKAIYFKTDIETIKNSKNEEFLYCHEFIDENNILLKFVKYYNVNPFNLF
jgi:hypothetical protein